MMRLNAILFLIVIASVGLSSCSSSSSSSPSPSEQKPEGIVLPVAILGEVSDVRRKILQNTLNETITTKFRIVPQERFEEAQEQAFQELDYEQCTEDQCIMLIQEMLQVEHLFQLEVIAEGQMVHLSLKLVTLYEKKNKTDFCEKCTTLQLRDRVRQLTLNLLSEVDTSEMDVVFTDPPEIEKKEISEPPKVEPKPQIKKPKPAERQQQDEDEDKHPSSDDFRLRVLGGSFSTASTSVSSFSLAFHWMGFGIGMSDLYYKLTSSGNNYDMTGHTIDLGYTFGENLSYTVGLGMIGEGKGIIISDGEKYQTSKVSGSTLYGLLGWNFGIIEALMGYQDFDFKYENFSNANGTEISEPFQITGGLLTFGLGVSF
jgi:hypothetical protein